MFKPMFKFVGAAALVLAMLCTTAKAAPAVPPNSIAADTILVVHVNAAHFNPDMVKDAAKVILGANADKADEPLAKFKEKYDKAVGVGVEGITLVIGEEKSAEGAEKKETPFAAYIQLKPGSDVKAAEEAMTSDMKPAEREKTAFEQQGDYLVMHEKDKPLPTTSDAARAEAFAAGLATVREASVQVAFIPTEHLKAEMAKEESPVKGLKEANAALANAKWATLAIKLGNNPGVSATVNAADADGAKQLSDGINAGLDDVKQQAANPAGGGAMAIFGPLVAPLIDGLRPTTNGNEVTVSIKGESLTSIATFAANMGLLGGKK